MTAAYFEDHPTDPEKVILRKPKHDFGEPWLPVSIGVDVTEAGAGVIGIYAMPDGTSQIFYSKFYPAPQRPWVGLTDKERREVWDSCERQTPTTYVKAIEANLKEKNT